MDLPKIIEQTFYPFIIQYLQDLGFEAFGVTKVDKQYPDILFRVDSLSFLIEVKFGNPSIGLSAVAQAYDYAKKLETQNIIILIYPEKYRKQPILQQEMVQKIALNEEINTLILTEYWTESLIIDVKTLFNRLKEKISKKETKIDFKTIVDLIEKYVRDLNVIVYQVKTDELISEVVNQLDLFSSISEIKDTDTAKKQVVNLATYLLFNQLLFYHIYKKKTNSSKLPELSEIKDIKDLQGYFDKITNIDYQSIYQVNILGHIPNEKDVISTINEVIKAIKLLRAEHITDDLAGRFFHDLIPFEVRKILAAFYTHPVAAEILAELTIDSWNETVIDPACGSGTLLVAAYKKKQELYENLYGYSEHEKMHKQFIENDLTGLDIMPFAAHISAINLTMQNVAYETNVVRIGVKDALELAPQLATSSFKKKGVKISPYTTTIQRTLFDLYKPKTKKEGAITPEGKGTEFFIKPVDVVLMNPPFSDRQKMPVEMREKLKNNILGGICGHQINLWGYFLALSDLLLKPGGKIGAIIPINIARGKATEKIRDFLLKNYHIKYIVKTVSDIAFSEGAQFKDILFVATKKRPQSDDITKIIFINKSINLLSKSKKGIKNFLQLVNEIVKIKEITYNDLLKNKENLMPFLLPGNLSILFDRLKVSSKLTNFNINVLANGLPFRPKGVADAVFITRPSDKSRITKAKIVLDSEGDKQITVKFKNVPLEQFSFALNKEEIKFALRTITGINNISLNSNNVDYILTKNNTVYLNLLKKYEIKIPHPFPFNKHLKKNIIKKGAHLIIPDKINLVSPNTCVISVYSEIPLYCVGSTLWYLKNNSLSKNDLKILALYFNSIVTLIQFLLLKAETLGTYSRLLKNDWSLIKIINISTLSKYEKKTLINLFEELKNVKLPSILEQMENRFWAREKLDKTILNIMGFSLQEINNLLPDIYAALINELRLMKDSS